MPIITIYCNETPIIRAVELSLCSSLMLMSLCVITTALEFINWPLDTGWSWELARNSETTIFPVSLLIICMLPPCVLQVQGVQADYY